MMRMSVPRSSRWVAKLWRSACSVTPFLIPAASAASWKRRLSWRVVIGLPILAALGLLDANDLLRAVDMLDLQPDHLACAQSAAVAETEQNAGFEAAGDRQQPLGLVRAHDQRNLLRLTDVINLGGEVQAPQGH